MGSGYHAPHDLGGQGYGSGRPGIKVDFGPYKTDDVGCAYFPVTLPYFAGSYWVNSIDDNGATLQTNIVLADPGSPFYTFPWEFQSLGIVPPGGIVFDSQHFTGLPALATFTSTLFFQQRFQAIGFSYYLGVYPWASNAASKGVCQVLSMPVCQVNSNKLILIRMSLPWGGWLDDDGTGSQFWSATNTDPHTDGLEADIANPYVTASDNNSMWLGNGAITAINNNRCTVKPAPWENGSISQASLLMAQVWHIGGCN